MQVELFKHGFELHVSLISDIFKYKLRLNYYIVIRVIIRKKKNNLKFSDLWNYGWIFNPQQKWNLIYLKIRIFTSYLLKLTKILNFSNIPSENFEF